MAASDFDFLHGTWTVANRRLRDPHDPAADVWEEFASTCVCRSVLGGLGNVDEFVSVDGGPDGAPFRGMTVRLYDPAADRWRIWWAADRRPGVLDDPMEGGFADGHGAFSGRDRGLEVRFDWYVDGPRWVQSFRHGEAWIENWEMRFTAVR
jgi:hypothetical protein